MKNRSYHMGSALVLTGALIAGFALAEDKEKADTKMAEMMKKVEVAGTPGAPHKALESLVGDWVAEVKLWMTPGTEPHVSKATATSKWAMNGRFVEQEFQGEMMGKPFRGMSLTGYDNTKQKFNSIWIDDMHTSMFTSEGTSEMGNKVITLEGKYHCPVTGEKDLTMKQVVRVISRDKHILEMYDPSKSGNAKTMEITYTRK